MRGQGMSAVSGMARSGKSARCRMGMISQREKELSCVGVGSRRGLAGSGEGVSSRLGWSTGGCGQSVTTGQGTRWRWLVGAQGCALGGGGQSFWGVPWWCVGGVRHGVGMTRRNGQARRRSAPG